MSWTGSASLVVAVLLAAAHNGFAVLPFPEAVNIHGFANAQGQRLVLQVLMPLSAIRDVKFPLRRDTDFVDIPGAKTMVRGLARYWVIDRLPVYQNDKLLDKPNVTNARLVAESDLNAGLADDANLTRNQIWLDLELTYALPDQGNSLELQPRLADLGVHVSTDLRFTGRNGAVREFTFMGDPGRFALEASGGDAAIQFLIRGMKALLAASDYLLFLFCLVLPMRRYQDIAPATVAFAAGLVFTLAVSGLHLAPDGLWLRPLIGTLAACAVLLSALANIAGKPKVRRRAWLALGGGLVIGFGLGFELVYELQFAAGHDAIAEIAFVCGSVLAAVLAIAVLVPVLAGLFRFARTQRVELIVVSALAADTAWQWISERWQELSRYPLTPPVFDASFFAMALRWLAILTVFGGLVWFVNGWLAAREQRTDA